MIITAKCTSCGDIVCIEHDSDQSVSCNAPCGNLTMTPSEDEGVNIIGNWCNPTDKDLEDLGIK